MKQRIRIQGSWRHIPCAWSDCKRSADRRLTVPGDKGKWAFCSEDHRVAWLRR